MRVIVEEVTEKDYPRFKKERKKSIEVSLFPLWEDQEMVITQEDDTPPERLDYQFCKLKYRK